MSGIHEKQKDDLTDTDAQTALLSQRGPLPIPPLSVREIGDAGRRENPGVPRHLQAAVWLTLALLGVGITMTVHNSGGRTHVSLPLGVNLPAAWASRASAESGSEKDRSMLGERAKLRAQNGNTTFDKAIEFKQKRHSGHDILGSEQRKHFGQDGSASDVQLKRQTSDPVDATPSDKTVLTTTLPPRIADAGHVVWASGMLGGTNKKKHWVAETVRKMEQVPVEQAPASDMLGEAKKKHSEAETVRKTHVAVEHAPLVGKEAAPRAAQLVVVKRPHEAPPLPSLYCYVFVIKKSVEPWLLRAHLVRGAGVFGCNSYNVFSDDDLDIGDTGVAAQFIVPLPGQPAWRGPVPGIEQEIWHNTGVFMRAWQWMYRTGRWRNHDWTVKVDPDTAFLPGRLQQQLSKRYKPSGEFKDYTNFMTYLDPKVPMYLLNCKQWYSFQGPLEIFSEAAADKFFGGLMTCKASLRWKDWGEDWFMAHCLDKVGVQKREGFGLLADTYCASNYQDGKTYRQTIKEQGPTCKDGRAAYHAYKTVPNLAKCLDQASDALEDFGVYQ